MDKKTSYDWKFKAVGGASRIDISRGEDLRHLGELDRKLWTVLSCPAGGLEFDQKTLDIIDSDGDGKIRVDDMIAVADYLTSVVRNADLVLEQKDSIELSEFDTGNPAGKRLQDSARQILLNLGKAKDSISLADTADSVAIFAGTRFNGDGVVTPASAADEGLAGIIREIAASTGGTMDRSGVTGVNAEQVEEFYSACADYAAWCAEGGSESTHPYGPDTESAFAALEAVAQKVDDYFIRCSLAAFSSESVPALDLQVSSISEISSKNLTACREQIAGYPLARITGEQLLRYDGINPAWAAAFSELRTKVLDRAYPGKESITAEEWESVVAGFSGYTAWKASKRGTAVEPLGIDRVKAILAEDGKASVLSLVEQDKALASEADGIDDVDRFLHLFRNFYGLLRNYVTFDDFFDKGSKAVFQAGCLFIDQRSLDLCIRVEDMGKHGDMARLSGMYIIYCSCVSKSGGKSMNIAAVLTDGDVDNLRVGMNALFYDRDGLDYDATITSIVDNPVSVRQAFFAPYKKLGRAIADRINKSAMERNDRVDAELAAKAASASIPADKESAAAAKAAVVPAPFDIAKFSGIFAAIGIALGMIGSAIMRIINPWYNVITLFVILVVCISGPSMFIAWRKLRSRNLAPVLNANGWAINARILVNIPFGASLTALAKFPAIESVDLRAAQRRNFRRFRNTLLVILLLAAGGIYAGWRFRVSGRKAAVQDPSVQVESPQSPSPSPVEAD